MTEYAQPPVVGPEDDGEEEWVDTFSFGGTREYTIPGTEKNAQKIIFKILNEGDKAKYQRDTNREIRVSRKTQDAAFKPDPVAERHALIKASVVDWTLMTKGPQGPERATFTQAMLDNWLKVANPSIIEGLESAIRKANPWLITDDATEDEILEQIEELQQQLVLVRSKASGKG